MKISEIRFNLTELPPVKQFGFSKDIRMTRLGKTVLLAGPNGAGKTRLLNLLEHVVNFPKGSTITENNEDISDIQNILNQVKSSIEQLTSEEEVKARIKLIEQRENEKNDLELKNLYLRSMSSSPNPGEISIFKYVPERADIENPEKLTLDAIRHNANINRSVGFGQSKVGTPSYIRQVLMEGFNASHQENTNDALADQKVSDATELKAAINLILGDKANPRYLIEGRIEIFGRTDYFSSLSSGQKMLLQMATALHAQKTRLQNVILILDEPELYLHPAAQVEVISKLKEIQNDGQLWISTHSLPLIAHLVHDEPESLWFVFDGELTHAGRKPELVINGLLGGATGATRIQEFMQLPAQFAANRFLAECLFPPKTIGPDATDPQTSHIGKIITDLAEKKSEGRLRVLDFGAGKGRLLAALREMDETNSLDKRIDYIAYDFFESDAEQCQAEIARTYFSSSSEADSMLEAKGQYFNHLRDLAARVNANSVDIVVMCNVLHELPPASWLDLFGNDSYLARLLRPDGYLLVVEDYAMPVGEKAHHHGFLLLNENELTQLFSIGEEDRASNNFSMSDARASQASKANRLKAFLIAAPIVSRVTCETRYAAIKALKQNSKEQIKEIRSADRTTVQDGMAYALAAQLYANAALWLDDNQNKPDN